MKKVRFETPSKISVFGGMNDTDCHSPRPFFVQRDAPKAPDIRSRHPKLLLYSNDPLQRYECSNSSPYPYVNKTSLSIHERDPKCLPSNDLELSILDSSDMEPRHPTHKQTVFHQMKENVFLKDTSDCMLKVLTPIENTKLSVPQNRHGMEDSFFIRHDNIGKLHLQNVNSLQNKLNKLDFIDKENDPIAKKKEWNMLKNGNVISPRISDYSSHITENSCNCHHCTKIVQNSHRLSPFVNVPSNIPSLCCQDEKAYYCHHVSPPPIKSCYCNHNTHATQVPLCSSNKTDVLIQPEPMNAVDKKTVAIQKYEESRKTDCTEVVKQTNIEKEKREPTVSDLFKIIKLQNEQLQLLQEKVDKFINSSQNKQNVQPIQNFVTERVSLEGIDQEQHKISIGVMTSFEMVRTSTFINKEILKHASDNAQIQCNRSQVSIKEAVSKQHSTSQPISQNFLEGITPIGKALHPEHSINSSMYENNVTNIVAAGQNANDLNDEKTLNELSLCNVQVDNATTPLLSPEQTLYLDVRDYSDSDSGGDDQSNVGWTYYNKVMTHVNGILQDSDMPSSASALYRNARQQCVQMQIDKTNVSVTKRVKFGDDPLGLRQQQVFTASTDTSIKMKQLAAKYLNCPLPVATQGPVVTPTVPIDMSFATRNYMERHQLIQGSSPTFRCPQDEIPRFLDITALKQQPKLL